MQFLTNEQTVDKILSIAQKTYKVKTIIALSSWGNDSVVSTKLAYEWWKKNRRLNLNFKIITLDTGLATDGYLEYATAQAKNMLGVKQVYSGLFSIEDNPKVGFNWYAADALKYGFGYTPNKHAMFYYRMLKERTIMKVLRETKNHRFDNIMFISGVFREESITRKIVPAIKNFYGVKKIYLNIDIL
jgi:3'-phosphoadenosine 5'-phosphosulfate sulfotransferase (PAPS reductase)/FAD synthetase